MFYRILQNRIRDVQRRRSVRSRVLSFFGGTVEGEEYDPIVEAPAPRSENPLEQAQAGDAMQALEQALLTLPARQREAFALRNFEGLDVAQTAVAMSCTRRQRKDALLARRASAARVARGAWRGALAMSERGDAAARDRVSTAISSAARSEAFDDSVAALDAATRSRLTQARYRALEELPSGGTRRRWRWWLVPAGGGGGGGARRVVHRSDRAIPRRDAGLQQAVALGDLEILLGEEDLEMLRRGDRVLRLARGAAGVHASRAAIASADAPVSLRAARARLPVARARRGGAAARGTPADAGPDLEFLEYLGSWAEEDDEWLAIEEWEKDNPAAEEDGADENDEGGAPPERRGTTMMRANRLVATCIVLLAFAGGRERARHRVGRLERGAAAAAGSAASKTGTSSSRCASSRSRAAPSVGSR